MTVSATGLWKSRGTSLASIFVFAVVRPARRDAVGIAVCAASQIALMAMVALRPASGRTPVASGPQSNSMIELFLHNAGVYLLWLAGAFTLGIVPVALATLSAVVAGIAIGGAVSAHGPAALAFLGHGLLEIPALAIALWLALRPVLDLWAARRQSDDGRVYARELLRSWISLTVLAFLMLFLAAVWETAVVPTW